eukprot:1969471-Prymnesium_polylepis.2
MLRWTFCVWRFLSAAGEWPLDAGWALGARRIGRVGAPGDGALVGAAPLPGRLRRGRLRHRRELGQPRRRCD